MEDTIWNYNCFVYEVTGMKQYPIPVNISPTVIKFRTCWFSTFIGSGKYEQLLTYLCIFQRQNKEIYWL